MLRRAPGQWQIHRIGDSGFECVGRDYTASPRGGMQGGNILRLPEFWTTRTVFRI